MARRLLAVLAVMGGLMLLAVAAAWAIPHEPAACAVSENEAMPWLRDMHAACPVAEGGTEPPPPDHF